MIQPHCRDYLSIQFLIKKNTNISKTLILAALYELIFKTFFKINLAE